MSDQKQPNTEQEKKQFYSVNLTPERIFILFVIFVVIIAAVIIILAFSLSGKSAGKGTSADNEIDMANSMADSDFNYHDILFDDNSADTAAAETETPQQEENVAANNPETTAKEPTKTAAAETKPEVVKINEDKIIYSSKFADQEEKTETTAPAKQATATKPTEKPATTTQKTATATKTAEPAKTETKPAPAKAAPVKKYVIQIASYSSAKTANEVAAFYKSAGYTAYTKEFTKDGKTYYRLRVGPYENKAKADELLARIKSSKYGKDSFISVGYY